MTTADTFATPYRVSTITCNGSLGKHIGEVYLDKLFENIDIVDSEDAIGFIYMVDKEGKNTKGVSPRKEKKTHAKKLKDEDINKKRRFDNAISGYFRTSQGYSPSVKIFKNGTIQMTGLKKIEDGQELHVRVFNVFSKLVEKTPEIVKNNELKCSDFFVRLINSDFSVPFNVRRKDLHHLLISDEYNNTSSFQPGTYPGVKIQYCWNAEYNKNDGCCKCTQKCFGKGNGSGDGQCKKITISVFESGKILITGAVTFEQIDRAYEYICFVLKKNQVLLQKVVPLPQVRNIL